MNRLVLLSSVLFFAVYGEASTSVSSASLKDIRGDSQVVTNISGLAALDASVSAINAHLSAEDARFVSTNYDSRVRLPEAYVQVNVSNEWLTVWSEMTRWNHFLTNDFYAVQTNLAEKADRAWGYYDSHSGAYAPEGYTWISSPRVALAAGMAYQRTITTEGAVWVLESNGLVTDLGGTTNGVFRISDDEGNALFEIVKGDKRIVGCSAGSCTTIAGPYATTHLQVTYAVVSDAHPTLSFTTSLTNNTWYAETAADCPATAEWSGASGAWVCTFYGKTALPALFARATVELGGDTVIKHTAPTSLQKIVIGTTTYTVGTATIRGNTVLTLTPAL